MQPYRTYAELFAGIGGWGEGAKALLLRPIFFVESDERIASWHLRNSPTSQPFAIPIQDVNLARLPTSNIDILYASPPCQGYSTARTKLTVHTDLDIGLHILRFVRYLEPRVILIENVRQYLNFPTAQKIIHELSRLGYSVASGLINCWEYGIPQDRIRSVILASRDMPIMPPSPPTLREKQGWLASQRDLDYEPSSWMPSIARHVPTTNQSSLFDWLSNNYHKEAHKLAGKWTYTMPLDRDEYTAFLLPTGNTTREITWRADFHPATTVTARCGGHHYRIIDRRYPEIMQLSMRGLARLQTFPDTFQLPAIRSFAGLLIGNAVPPLLSTELTRHMIPNANA